MEELPTPLSPELAATVVVLVDGPRVDVVAGAGVAAAVAAIAWLATARALVGAIAFCVAFPVAARLIRALRLRGLRLKLARDPTLAAQRVQASWAKASPGQRAALAMLVKKSR